MSNVSNISNERYMRPLSKNPENITEQIKEDLIELKDSVILNMSIFSSVLWV